MDHSNTVIRLENISFSYPGSTCKVLDGLNFQIRKGEKIGMIAPNGSGKTTLLHTIMGLCRPDEGEIEIFGKHMIKESDFIPIRTKIGLLFQDSDDQLFCPTVLEDVAFGPLNMGFSRTESIHMADTVLAELGILDLADQVTHRMSGGQKRLVALAAVLAMSPEVLLLDEPTAGLDHQVKEKLIRILNELEITCLLISHEFDFLQAVAGKIYSMENGRVLTDEQVHIHQHEHMHRHGKHPHNHT